MPILQIRELPEDLYRALRDAAARSHRSIAQQAIVELRKAQAIDVAPRHGVLDRLGSDDHATSRPRTVPAPETLVREDRKR